MPPGQTIYTAIINGPLVDMILTAVIDVPCVTAAVNDGRQTFHYNKLFYILIFIKCVKNDVSCYFISDTYRTRSSAVAERPRDASCH